MPQGTDLFRLNAKQGRSRRSVDELVEATTQLLATEPEVNKISTNSIAARAGASIGSLYRYFRNKESLFQIIAMYQLENFEVQFEEKILKTTEKTPDVVARLLVHQALTPFKNRNTVRKRLISLVGNNERVQCALAVTLDRLTLRSLEVLDISYESVSRAHRLILLRSVLGPIRAAALYEPELLGQNEFEDELVSLLVWQIDRLLTKQQLPDR